MTHPIAPRLKGSITALVTPFAGAKIDEKAFQDFVAWQIAEGTQGLVPCGTTGESATLSDAEQERLIRLTVEVAAGKVPVIAGTGSNNTAHAAHLMQAAKKAGADAALIVTPYYNKPTQEGLIHHYTTLHDSTELPIVIYNIPGRSVIDMTVETFIRLAALPRIVGVKDATADLLRPLRLRAALGPDFVQLSGEDGTVVPFLAQGGHGCISVTSNVAPRLCAELHHAWARKDWPRVEALRDRLLPLHQALFVESNPAPAKYALSLLGKVANTLRAPLVPVRISTQDAMRAALQQVGIWEGAASVAAE